jgi:hypothetical protein
VDISDTIGQTHESTTKGRKTEVTPFEPVMETDARPIELVEPTGWERVKYHLGYPLPERYRAWIERDVASPGFLVRWSLLRTVAAVIGLALLRIFVDFEVWPFVVGSVIASVIIVSVRSFADFQRRQVIGYHEKRWERIRTRDEGPDMRRLPNP